MAKREINYINLIYELKNIERNDMEAMNSLLCRYDIRNVECLQRKVFHYIFSINDSKLAMNFVDMLLKTSSLPIVNECHSIIKSNIAKEEYVSKHIEDVKEMRDALSIKYDFCVKIISQSSFLQEKHKLSIEYNKYFLFDTIVIDEIDTNYINLIYDLGKAGKNNKAAFSGVLYLYDIAKIQTLERRVLDYVFGINDDELRFKLINIIAEANNLPIITECYSIIYSGVSKEMYVSSKLKINSSKANVFNIKYELCMSIITQSSYLQEKQRTVAQCKQQSSINTKLGNPQVIRHRNRGRTIRE